MTVYYITEQHDLQDKVLPVLQQKTSWGFDTETTGLDPNSNKVILMQIGDSETQFVIDTRKVNPEPLRGFLESLNYYKYGHNLKFDYKMVKASFGIEIERCRDTFIAEKLITNGLKFSGFKLLDLVKNYLDIILENKEELQKSFINHVGDFSPEQIAYAAKDVEYMIPLQKKVIAEIKRQQLADTFFLECEAIPTFGDLELHGVPLNQVEWAKIADENLKQAEAIIPQLNYYMYQIPNSKFVKKMTDPLFGELRINYNSSDQVVEAMNALGIKNKEIDKDTGDIIEKIIEDSSDKTLKKLKEYPFVGLIKKYRSFMIRYNTFGYSFIKAIHPKTGRIHLNLDQLGTETGRIASGKSPVNMLNIPRDKRMRNCFFAPENYVIETDDYSGCELRIWAEISKDPSLCKALIDGTDLHCYAASKLYGLPVSKTENKHLRTPAKTINFSIIYGANAYSLFDKLNGEGFPITLPEAQNLFNKYCKEFEVGVRYIRAQGLQASKEGYLVNLNGRRRSWLLPDPRDLQKFANGALDKKYIGIIKAIAREGGNFKVQSVNADITKLAMINIRKYIKRNKVRSGLMLQVYDEIVTCTHKDDSPDFQIVKNRIMVEAAEKWIKTIPMTVDGCVHPYWTKE